MSHLPSAAEPANTPGATPRELVVGPVATEESAADVDMVAAASFLRAQLVGRYESILLGTDATRGSGPALRLLAHNCAVHLVPGGSLAVSDTNDTISKHLNACGFERLGGSGPRSFWRRTSRRTIHDVTAEARGRLDRVTPHELARRLASGDVTVVDLRIPADRLRHGVIAGSVGIPRTVLEWRADPTSGYSNAAFRSFDQAIVVVCNEGYSSSIAAAGLIDLGYNSATDLVGGMVAWVGDGHHVATPAPSDETTFEGPVESG